MSTEDDELRPSTRTSSDQPTEHEDQLLGKRETITQACKEHNITKLIELADSPGGLLDDELRRLAWPLLLNCADEQVANNHASKVWESLPPHREEEQVQRDVDRAFVYYPKSDSQEDIQSNKTKLFNLIVMILRTHRMLCYFQGYHDIVQVFLLVMGEADAYSVVASLSLCRIRDYMLPSITPAIKHLRLIPAILQVADAPLAQHLSQTEPFFALSATLTLYAHDIQEYSDIARLYDFILAHEPIITIYLFASTILKRREKLMAIPLAEPEMLHFTLSKLPQPLDLETLIQATLKLFQEFPPDKLPGGVWGRMSPYSVLKTSRSIQEKQYLKDAETLFGKQETQLAREEKLKVGLLYLSKNKVPIASVGTAVLFGVLAIWLQRSGHSGSIWQALNLWLRRK